MKLLIAAVFLLSTLMRASQAGEAGVPTAVEISQALERGKSVRTQKGVVPEALIKTAVVLKAAGVRCGYTLVTIEDAKGEGGATYKMTERIKGVLPRNLDTEVVEYVGVIMMDADLALLSGTQTTTKVVTSPKATEKETVSAEMIVKGGELSWVRKEKRADDPEFVEKSDPVKLHGVRLVPHNALIALAAFAAKEPGFKAGVSSPFCVPSLDTGGTIDSFLIQPAWLETDVPKDKTNPAAKLVFRVRILEGELNEKGMNVEPPSSEGWTDSLDWTLDANFHVGALPTSPDSLITAEIADPETLDPNAPMDFVKIKEAMKALEDKRRKDDEHLTKVPLK